MQKKNTYQKPSLVKAGVTLQSVAAGGPSTMPV